MAETNNVLMDKIRSFNLEQVLRLQPNYPPVAIEVEPSGMTITRLKRSRRAAPKLEVHKTRDLDLQDLTSNFKRPNAAASQSLGLEFGKLFQQSGIKPGKIVLVLPDNLARTSIVALPDKPTTPAHLEELLKFKIKRSIPFRIEDAMMSYQVLEEPHGGMRVLVSLMRRVVVQHFESALESTGARVGLIDLCTPNLLNLFQETIAKHPNDCALLNVTPHYFTMMILRKGVIVFFRTKPFQVGDEATGMAVTDEFAERVLGRELSTSLGYYKDKLDGTGISQLFVRTTGLPFEAIQHRAGALDLHSAQLLDPTPHLELGPGLRLESSVGQRLAPALGGAIGRG